MNRRWADRLLGIALGLAIGFGVLVYFVFVHSEGTIDAPRIDGGAAAGQATVVSRPATRPGPAERGTNDEGGARPPGRAPPVVKVVGGAPPTASGPAQLSFRQGERVRFEIETDEPFSFEIHGLGIARSIEGNSVVSFPATKVGQFPVVARATQIGVADLRIEPRHSGMPVEHSGR